MSGTQASWIIPITVVLTCLPRQAKGTKAYYMHAWRGEKAHIWREMVHIIKQDTPTNNRGRKGTCLRSTDL